MLQQIQIRGLCTSRGVAVESVFTATPTSQRTTGASADKAAHLTRVRDRANIDLVSRTQSFVSRVTACGVALAIACVSAATCLAAVMQMPDMQRHACCAGMAEDCGHDGGTMAVQEDCCAVQNADVARLGSAGLITLPVVAGIRMPEPVRLAPDAVPAFDPPKASRTPTYLIVSSFRI